MAEKPSHILVVDDELSMRELLEYMLNKEGYQVTCAEDGRQAIRLIEKSQYDLLLCDIKLGDISGLDVLRASKKANQDTVVILISAYASTETAVEAMNEGAYDYVPKPFDKDELKYRVKIGERIIRLEQRILQLAKTDHLTGLLNRRGFMERMDQELQRAYRQNAPFSLILADIDYFKRINDTYGHQAGDLVLQRFAGQLKKNVAAL